MSLKAARVTGSANAIPNKCRVLGIWVLGGATNGTVTLTDPATPTGTGGTTVAVFGVPGITTSGTTFAGFIPIPSDGGNGGLAFATGCAVALSVATEATLLFAAG